MNPTFYFVLAFTAVLAANVCGAVLDIDGDIIFRGSYYVLPFVRGRGGGLTLSGRGGEICPLDIVQESSEIDEGIPVKFSNWAPKIASVPESSNLNIETVVGATICIQSTYWRVGEFDKERKQYFVVAGPKPEGFGQDSSKSFFQIVKSRDDTYKFVFCPRTCDSGRPKCSDVGIFVDEIGVRRLALSSKPFLVKFKKANVTEISSKTISVRVRVEGYDVSLSYDDVASALKAYFSSCGEVTRVSILRYKETEVFLPTLNRYAFLYITGEGAEEKALKLSGSDVGGWTVIVITDRITEPSARRAPNSKYTTNFLETRALIKVTGYDASLPADDIKTALSKHFSSCGEIEKVTIGGHPSSCRAIVYITGEGAQEKALALSGSDMGGCKLVAKPAMVPVKNRKRIHHGAPHLAHLFKEAQMYWGAQMAKTMKNTEEAKMLWVNEMGMGSDIPPEVMMLWDAEMSRRDLLPKN